MKDLFASLLAGLGYFYGYQYLVAWLSGQALVWRLVAVAPEPWRPALIWPAQVLETGLAAVVAALLPALVLALGAPAVRYSAALLIGITVGVASFAPAMGYMWFSGLGFDTLWRVRITEFLLMPALLLGVVWLIHKSRQGE